MAVLVTGASGHIGGNLIRALLARGIRPRALVRENRRALDGLDLDLVRGDVLDPESLRRAAAGTDVVYHLAGRISVVETDAAETWAVNVEGTRNVVAVCREVGVKRLAHVSSIHALAPEPEDRPVNETRPLAEGPHTPQYDRSKAAGEREVLAGVGRGLDAVIINPTAVMGPHDYRPSAMGQVLLDLYHRRIPALVVGGFDWVDVRDVLLSGHRATLRELAVMAGEITGRKAPGLVIPMWLAQASVPLAAVAASLAGQSPRMTTASLRALRAHRDIRHDKATRELGYAPRPLHDTLADTYAWFRAERVL